MLACVTAILRLCDFHWAPLQECKTRTNPSLRFGSGNSPATGSTGEPLLKKRGLLQTRTKRKGPLPTKGNRRQIGASLYSGAFVLRGAERFRFLPRLFGVLQGYGRRVFQSRAFFQAVNEPDSFVLPIDLSDFCLKHLLPRVARPVGQSLQH